MDKLKEKWSEVLDIIEREVTAVSFDIWFKNLKPFDVSGDLITLEAVSTSAKAQITKNYSNLLIYAINKIFPDIKNFDIIDQEEKANFEKNRNIQQKEEPKIVRENPFNKKYTFDNFVVGKSNQFVYAAAKRVAEDLGVKFNPFFIYGGVGLGKTHILHAIGNYCIENYPSLNVCYVTSNKFTNDYITSLTSGGKELNLNFREKYRNVDVLMIDDIQFLENKQSTQEEFFHTFNDLYQANKQIIIASDRNPKELTGLTDRLISRFQSGLIQDIQSPDFETRLAILRKKAQLEHYKISEEALVMIAEKIDSNIRELEGFLQKVCFYSQLLGKDETTASDVTDSLKEVVEQNKKAEPDTILSCICKYYNIKKDDLIGKKKTKEIVEPRQIAMYLMTEILPDLPLVSIGEIFGGRDHTTVIHARDKITENLKINSDLKTQINDLKTLINDNNF